LSFIRITSIGTFFWQVFNGAMVYVCFDGSKLTVAQLQRHQRSYRDREEGCSSSAVLILDECDRAEKSTEHIPRDVLQGIRQTYHHFLRESSVCVDSGHFMLGQH
jgi:hypothetical protein